jgi:GTPase SAR1 family protein
MNSNDKMIKITLLGLSGSGKTSFLSGVWQAFIDGGVTGTDGSLLNVTCSEGDAFICGDNAKSIGFNLGQLKDQFWIRRNMASQSKDGRIGSAAAGTVEMTQVNLNWDVEAPGARYSQPIRITDYRGGLLSLNRENVTEMDEEEISTLADELYDSEVILILLDGIKLAQHAGNQSLRKEKTGADRLNVLMNAVMKKPRRGTVVMVGITKVDSDIIPAKYKEDNYKALCQLACATLDGVYNHAKFMTRYGWTFAVVPLSAVGEGNSVTQYIPEMDDYVCAIKAGADVRQQQIDSAVIYAMRNVFTRRCKDLNREMENHDAKIEEEYSKMTLFTSRARRAYIEEHRKKKSECEAIYNKYSSILDVMNEGFASHYTAVRRFGVG